MNKMNLNIQLFASGASCSVTVTEVPGSATENSSTFTISAKVSTGSQTYNYSNAYVSGSYSGGASGSLSKQTFSINKSSSVTKTWSNVVIPHNPDGTLGDITFSIKFYVTNSSNGTTNKTVTPTYIPRYFSQTPSITFRSKTETSISYNWNTSEYCSAMTLNGSGILSGFSAGTSGVITVSGLTANTPYTHSVKCTRSDSGLQTDSNTISNTYTYNYPYVSAIGSNPLTIGNNQNLTLYNPLGRNVTVYMKQNNTGGTQFDIKSNITGTSVTMTPSANSLYASISNSVEGTACYYCTYNDGTEHTISTPTGKYKTTGNEKPTFSSGNVTVSTNYSNLTGNTNTQIKGNTTVTVNVNTAAICNDSSTFSKYTISQEGVTTQTLTTSTGSKTLTGGTSKNITITVYDSRGYSTDVTKEIGELVNYVNPNMSGSSSRADGVSQTVRVNLSGNIYFDKFGSQGVSNEVVELKYRISENTTFSGSYTQIDVQNISYETGSNNLRSFKLNSYQLSDSFTLGTKYYIEFTLSDKLKTIVYVVPVTSGLIARDVYLKNGSYHTGINGLGNDNYAEYVNGTFHSTGAISTDGDINAGTNKLNVGRIELSTSTPYIDFHFNNSTADYTSRIIENSSGKLDVTGKLETYGEVIGGLNNSLGQLRAVYGNYGFLVRNDGSNTYFMLTDSGNAYGAWNGLRPLTIDNATGLVHFGNGVRINNDTNMLLDGGRIEKNAGTWWIGGRDEAIIKNTRVDGGSWNPVTDNITPNGDVSTGTLGDCWFVQYTPNSNYNAGNNANNNLQIDLTDSYYCNFYTTKGEFKFNRRVYANDFYSSGGLYQNGGYAVPRCVHVGWATSMGFSLTDGQQAVVILNHDQMAILWSVSSGTSINKTNIKGSAIQASISNSWVTVTISGGGAFAGTAFLSP